MLARLLVITTAVFLLGGWRDPVPNWPYSGPMPDQPASVPPTHYDPVLRGTQSFRPVEPMPWGDVNRRVAPPEAAPAPAPAKPGEQSAPAPSEGSPSGHIGHEGH